MGYTFHSVPLPRGPHPAKGSPPSEVLASVYGHAAFRGVQAEVVAHVMAGNDVLATMPTGGGKSLAYQVPAMSLPGTAIVVSPLVALMRDQCDALRRRGVRAAALVGERMMGAEERNEIEGAFSSGKLDLLYVSPERLAGSRLASLASTTRISLAAIDEAHCVCEWGHGFRPDYLTIPDGLAAFPRRPRVALTASASLAARDEILWRLLSPDAAEISGGFDRPNIELEVSQERRPLESFLALLRTRPQGEAAVAYCRSRRDAERAASVIAEAGWVSACYHAGMDEGARNRSQDAFLSGSVQVVAATSAFGMGIDKPDVGLVGHLGLPSSVEAYYQESGRAGRDGRQALAWLAWSPGEVGQRAHRVAEESDASARAREEARFEGVMAYVESPGCRRASLLRRFGEFYPAPCGHCDRCASPPAYEDGAERVTTLLAAAARVSGEGGIADLIRLISGSEGASAAWRGMGAVGNAVSARLLFRQCAGAGFVGLDERDGTVRLLPDGFRALRDGPGLMLPVPGRPRPRTATGSTSLTGWRADLWPVIVRILTESSVEAPGAKATRLIAAAGTVEGLRSACGGLDESVAEAVESAAEAARPKGDEPRPPPFDLF